MAIWKLPLLLLATAATGSLTDATQKVLGTAPPAPPRIDPDPAVLAALAAHTDPIDAFLSLRPDAAAALAQRRLLRVAGEPEPQWLTESDKMRLRHKGKKFTDITDHQDFYV
jgi:leucyl aminopeptidase